MIIPMFKFQIHNYNIILSQPTRNKIKTIEARNQTNKHTYLIFHYLYMTSKFLQPLSFDFWVLLGTMFNVAKSRYVSIRIFFLSRLHFCSLPFYSIWATHPCIFAQFQRKESKHFYVFELKKKKNVLKVKCL